jgi:hypothetical protein
MPPLTIQQCEAELGKLARYIGTSNYEFVRPKIDTLLDTWLLLRHERVMWGYEPVEDT